MKKFFAILFLFSALMLPSAALAAETNGAELIEQHHTPLENNGYENGYYPASNIGLLQITNFSRATEQPFGNVFFAIYPLYGGMEGERVGVIVTDIDGATSATELPRGFYTIRQLPHTLPEGYQAHGDFSVYIFPETLLELRIFNEPTAEPQPQPTPPPQTHAHGRLIVTVRAVGTNEHLRGVVLELRRAMDNALVAEMVTDNFGEASVMLPAGDYFLREISPARGFQANPARTNVRITAERVTEINLRSQPIPVVEREAVPIVPEIQAPKYGRLLITNTAQGADDFIRGALFEIRGTMDNRLVAQIRTDQFGEATANLPVGDFYFRQISVPQGYVLDNTRTNFRISADELLSLSVVNRAYEAEQPPQHGRLLVTIISGATGGRIPGAGLTVHDIMTDGMVAEMHTDGFGEASVILKTGRFFLRQAHLPQGYTLNLDRFPITINANDITDMSLVARPVPVPTPAPTPTPAPAAASAPPITIETTAGDYETYGRLEIITRAAGSGNPLSGGIFAVYNADTNRRIAELTTGADGTAYTMLEPGKYFVQELRPTFGFLLEPHRMFLEIGTSEAVTVEITKERDEAVEYLSLCANTKGGGIIYIPPTGQYMDMWYYLGGGVLIALSIFGAVVLVVKKRGELKRCQLAD